MSKKDKKVDHVNKDNTTITNCVFNGVVFDANTVTAVEAIAVGLTETAKSLGELASVLKFGAVNNSPLINIGPIGPAEIKTPAGFYYEPAHD